VIELDGQPGSYRLHVSSPAGDVSGDVRLDPAYLGVDLDTLQVRVLASATTSRSVVPELERPLRQVGQALFEAVFQVSAGALFLSSRSEVERAGGRLRIVLRLHPPELAVLPWELLFSEHYGGYLCRRSSIVRYVAAPEPVRALTVTPPLRVLGMTALPGDLAALDAGTEQRRLQELLAPLQARGLITVDWVPGQSWEAAQDALYAGCQVFHFIGHGRFDPGRGEGVIAFASERGRRQLVGASALADLLSVADPMPRLVVLNSCQTAAGSDTDVFSSTAATLVRTVPGVVAMQFAITDDAAAVFSRAFYQALVHNRGVDEAVRAGRIALTGWNPDTLEWVTPVLYLRSWDTRLFDLTDSGTAPVGAVDQLQRRRDAVLARYWAARSTGDWEPVISQLGTLAVELPGDREVRQAYQDARLAARYVQGRRAEQEQDWSSAVAHYQAVTDAQPEYRDVGARLGECSRRRDIATLQEQLRVMFTAGEFQAVAGIAGRLAELDPSAADPDGLTSQARQLQQREADLPSAEPLPAAIPASGPADAWLETREQMRKEALRDEAETPGHLGESPISTSAPEPDPDLDKEAPRAPGVDFIRRAISRRLLILAVGAAIAVTGLLTVILVLPGTPSTRSASTPSLLFASVISNSNLLPGGSATRVAHLGTGRYEVTFATDVSGCAYVATTVHAGSQALQVFTAGGHSNSDGVYVETKNQDGALADGAFNLVVDCGRPGTFFAVVGYTANLTRSSPGTALTILGVGRYDVNFTSNVRQCAYLATVGDPGNALVSNPAGVYTGSASSSGTVYIETKNEEGGLAAGIPFHLAVICPTAANTQIAVVGADGNVVRGSAAMYSSSTATGEYVIASDRSISACAAVATRGSTDVSVPYYPTTVEIVQGLPGNMVGIQTRNLLALGGKPDSQAFHVAIVC